MSRKQYLPRISVAENNEWTPVSDMITGYDELAWDDKIVASRNFRKLNLHYDYATANIRLADGSRTTRTVFREKNHAKVTKSSFTKRQYPKREAPHPINIDWNLAFNSLVQLLDEAVDENAKLTEALTKTQQMLELEAERSRQFECRPVIEKLEPRAREYLKRFSKS